MHERVCLIVLGLCVAMAAGEARAQDAMESSEPSSEVAAEYVARPDGVATTYHVVRMRGEDVPYEAQAGMMPLVDGEGEIEARMFYIAYRRLRMPQAQWERERSAHVQRTGSEEGFEPNRLDPRTRPITFSFNGGPGSSSVWLHLGVFGPKRVAYADEIGNPGPPPYFVVDNDDSLLGVSDFVFLDPVSTGFSRAEEAGGEKAFHGVESDIESVAEAIRLYLSREGRWASPKFIAGESYGTTRAAGLSEHLLTEHGIALNGAVLVSSVMNFATLRFDVGNDLPYPLFVPTMAATAHFHEALDAEARARTLEAHVAQAERYAMERYLPALAKGARLDAGERERIAAELSELIGISAKEILDANLRVGMPMFSKALLRDRGQTVGRLDSRFTAVDRLRAGDSYEFDASYEAIRGNYTGSLNAYVRDELGYESDLPYEILTNVWPWSFEPAGSNRYLNVAERLRSAMARQPWMRVYIASGYFDLATPHFATDYTVDQLELPDDLRANIETLYYPSGHMMYVHGPSLRAMRDDLVSFYERTPRREP
ncbi:MAG: peptidase S10 [Planctomycetota bacterium]